MNKEEISLRIVKSWLQRHGWTIVHKKRTYKGHDVLAKDKEGNEQRIEVKYRSLPNFQKGTFDLTDKELTTCDFCFVVVFGPRPEHEYLGILKVDPEKHQKTTVFKHRIHMPYIHK